MKPAFEIARVAPGTVVIVLNRSGAVAVREALVNIQTAKIVPFNNADRGLLTALKKDADNVVLDLADEKAHRLCDLLENGLAAGQKLLPMVYALGEKLAHRIDPGCFFGPKTAAAEAA